VSPPRALLGAALVVTSVLAQTTLIGRLHLPYGRLDLILVVVVAIALAGGATAGTSAGFCAGLLADLLSDHPAGLLALVLCVTGFVCGLLPGSRVHRITRRLAVVAATVAGALAGATLGYAGLLAILGSPRLDWRVVTSYLPGSAAYDVILALAVVPVVTAMYQRLDR